MLRSLAAAARSAISGASRTRGEEYFCGGRVAIAETGDDRIAALVRGSRTYRVTLELEGTCLNVRCTCPRFADVAGVCKHIWATILAADTAAGLAATRRRHSAD